MTKKIFLDTNSLIYLMSGQEPFCSKVIEFLNECISDNSELYTSTITDAEFLVKPYSDKNFTAIENYKLCLKKLGIVKCFITDQIAETAARIRSIYPNIKLADSLQIASSIDCNCDIFFTNDRQLKQVSEANIVLISDL